MSTLTHEQIRAASERAFLDQVHAREADLRQRTLPILAQYTQGLLTFEEFVDDLHVEWYDAPEFPNDPQRL